MTKDGKPFPNKGTAAAAAKRAGEAPNTVTQVQGGYAAPRTPTQPPAQAKQPWEMTQDEFLAGKSGVDEVAVAKTAHASHVKRAVQENRPVPAEVLEAYKNNVWAKKALEAIQQPAPEPPPASESASQYKPGTVIPRSRDLDIRNTETLPRGTGARYLEVVPGPDGSLIAKQWRRKRTMDKGSLLIDTEAKLPPAPGSVPEAAPAEQQPPAPEATPDRAVPAQAVTWENELEGILEHADKLPSWVVARAKNDLKRSRGGEIEDYDEAMAEWANVVKAANLEDQHLYGGDVKAQPDLFGNGTTLFGSQGPQTLSVSRESLDQAAAAAVARAKALKEGRTRFAADSAAIPDDVAHHQRVRSRVSELDAQTGGKVRTQVVKSARELPNAVHRAAVEQGVNLQHVPAVYHNGEVIVISDNVRPGSMDRWWAHEHVAHEGLEGLLGRDGAEAFYETVARHVGRAAMAERVAHPADQLSDNQLAAEYVATLAESHQRNGMLDATETSIFARVVQAIKDALRALGLDIKLSDADILGVLAAASRNLRVSQAQGTAAAPAPAFAADSAVTPAQDAEYRAAVERGDMDAAQKMVDEAAKAAGYDVGPVLHGTPDVRGLNAYPVFDRSDVVTLVKDQQLAARIQAELDQEFQRGQEQGIHPSDRYMQLLDEAGRNRVTEDRLAPVFFSDSQSVARSYADDRRAFDYQGATPAIRRMYLRMNNPQTIDAQGRSWGKRGGRATQSEQIEQARASGHDGLIIRNTRDAYENNGQVRPHTVFVTFDAPSQVKSADPVTYDDAGNVIPLSERFNEQSPDIRFAVSPESELEGETAQRPTADLMGLLDLGLLAEALLDGKVPKVVQSMGRRAGVFRHEGSIALKASIFAGPTIAEFEVPTKEASEIEKEMVQRLVSEAGLNEDEIIVRRRAKKGGKTALNFIRRDHGYVKKVLAHEIGHAWDWMDDKVMKLGNVLGHIANLHEYMKTTLAELPGRSDILTEQDRKAAAKQAYHRARGQGLSPTKDKEAFAAARKSAYAEIIDSLIRTRGLITNEAVREELKALTRWWKPFDEARVEESYRAYRDSAKELIADALSVLLNNPDALRARAPQFSAAWRNYMNERPQAKQAYERTLEGMANGANQAEKYQRRVRGWRRGDTLIAKMLQGDRESLFSMFKQLRQRMGQTLFSKRAWSNSYYNRLLRQGIELQDDASPVSTARKSRYWSNLVMHLGTLMEQRVLRPLRRKGISEDLLNHYLQDARVAFGDRADFANPGYDTEEDANDHLTAMRREYGDEVMAALEEAQREFAAVRDEVVLQAMEQSGTFPKELVDRFRDNPYYVRFEVVDYIDQQHGAGSGLRLFEQIGTLKDVASPIMATFYRDSMLLKGILENTEKRATVTMLADYFGEALPAERKWDGSRMVWKEPAEKDRGLVLVYENGDVVGYDVPKQIASQFDHSQEIKGGYGLGDLLLGSLRFFSAASRLSFIGASIGFPLYSYLRDTQRSVQNAPGTATVPFRWTRETLGATRDLLRWFRGDYPPVIERMLKQGSLLTFMDVKYLNNTTGRQLRRLWAAWGIRHQDSVHMPYWQRVAFTAWHGMWNLRNGIEMVSKVAGQRYLERYTDLTQDQIANKVVSELGNPDFLDGGTGKPLLNSLFLFSNVQLQQLRGDYKALTGHDYVSLKEFAKGVKKNPDLAAKRSVTLAAQIGLWLLDRGLLLVMLRAMLGDDDERTKAVEKATTIYQGATDNDKATKWIISMVDYGNGLGGVLKIPKDETDRMLGNLVTTALDGIIGDGRWSMGDLSELINYMGDEAPTINPVLEIGAAYAKILSGQNPRDSWSGRPVVDDPNMWEMRDDPEYGHLATKEFGKWAWGKMGGHKFFNTPSEYQKQQRLAPEETFGRTLQEQQLEPWGGLWRDTIGRFYEVEDYGHVQHGRREALDPVRDQEARERLVKSLLAQSFADGVRPDMTDYERKIYNAFEDEIYEKARDIIRQRGMSPTQKLYQEAQNERQRRAVEKWNATP